MAEIYGIRLKNETQYFYIGVTVYTAASRFQSHLEEVRAQRHANNHFQNKVKKWGENNITFDVLARPANADRWHREAELIQEYIGKGHPLVNKIHNTLSYDIREMYERQMTQADVDYLLEHGFYVKAQNPELQWLADRIGDLLKLTVREMVTRFRPEVERRWPQLLEVDLS